MSSWVTYDASAIAAGSGLTSVAVARVVDVVERGLDQRGLRDQS
jgi:hypothetical protein